MSIHINVCCNHGKCDFAFGGCFDRPDETYEDLLNAYRSLGWTFDPPNGVAHSESEFDSRNKLPNSGPKAYCPIHAKEHPEAS